LIVYPDSSFLVSNDPADSNSPEAARRMASNPMILITLLHQAELANALYQ
jgi:hypothetical protein